MFLGQYEHTIDEKGRMIIPARFRELLLDGAYILQGFDRNLMILTAPSFEKVSQRIDQMSLTDPNARLLRRLIFSKAERLEIDKAGRALIPQYLRDSARLGSNAIVVGSGAYIEIWSPELWAQQDEELNENDADAQRFAALDLSML